MFRSTKQIYKDCLRTADHYAAKHGYNPEKIKRVVRMQFKRNMNETDQTKIDQLRADAMRSLNTYLTVESGLLDKMPDRSKAGNAFTNNDLQ